MDIDAPAMEAPSTHPGPSVPQQSIVDVVLRIPKEAAVVWKAVGDGACLFHSALQNNGIQAVRTAKAVVVAWIKENLERDVLQDG